MKKYFGFSFLIRLPTQRILYTGLHNLFIAPGSLGGLGYGPPKGSTVIYGSVQDSSSYGGYVSPSVQSPTSSATYGTTSPIHVPLPTPAPTTAYAAPAPSSPNYAPTPAPTPRSAPAPTIALASPHQMSYGAPKPATITMVVNTAAGHTTGQSSYGVQKDIAGNTKLTTPGTNAQDELPLLGHGYQFNGIDESNVVQNLKKSPEEEIAHLEPSQVRIITSNEQV